jgi:hypothetical protein
MEDTGQPQLNAPVNASRPRHHDAIEHRRYNPAPVSFAIRTRTAATIASRPGVFFFCISLPLLWLHISDICILWEFDLFLGPFHQNT